MTPIKKQFQSRIAFWIDDKLLGRLDSFADSREWKRGLVIREAIKTYLLIKDKD